ncbi:MAG: CHASE domain-containing protein [Anderseniella sp.]|nr:CHASE domain-containing protein [Anderseniella sp.]
MSRKTVSILILFSGLALSVIAGVIAYGVVESRRVQSDRFQAGAMVDELRNQTLLVEGSLRALRGFFAIQRDVSDAEFEGFAAQLAQPDYVRALQHVQFVKPEDLHDYERHQQQLRSRPFKVTERADGGATGPVQPRSHHYVIDLIHPYAGNERALGLDVASNATSADAIARAREGNRVAVSDSFPLVQSPAETAFLMYLPVASRALHDESGHFSGAVAALISLPALAAHWQTEQVSLTALTDVASGREIYAAPPVADDVNLVRVRLNVGDRQWEATVAIASSGSSTAASMLVFGLGALLTLVALGASEQSRLQAENRLVGSRLDQAEHARAVREAAYRSLFESTGTANVEIETGTGRAIKSNGRLLQLTSKSREAIEGKPLVDLFDAADHAGLIELLDEVNGADRSFRAIECRLLDATGKPHWVLLSIGERIENEAGGETASVVMQDISIAKENAQARDILVRELAHRVRNTMQLVSSIADQTAARSQTVPDYKSNLQSRLRALNVAQDALFDTNWGSLRLDLLVDKVLKPFSPEDEEGRLTISVAPVLVTAQQAQMIALALHELANNAARYGALVQDGGKVKLDIAVTPQKDGKADSMELLLVWSETGCANANGQPERRGFGTIMLDKLLARQYNGETRFTWRAEGLLFEARLPLSL